MQNNKSNAMEKKWNPDSDIIHMLPDVKKKKAKLKALGKMCEVKNG